MYYITYQFASQIITVTANNIHIGDGTTSFHDKHNTCHVIDSGTIISILPVRSARRKPSLPQG